MKWILSFGFMLCVILVCVVVCKITVFCFRKLSKSADSDIQPAEY